MNIIVTLAEFDHIKGAFVLYNSLKMNGFEGVFIIGHRNITPLSKEVIHFVEESNDLFLEEINPTRHLANYKPNFMKIISNKESKVNTITYMDPDIVVNCPVDFIMSWCKNGPTVCGDVNYHMPSNHPSRLKWLEITKCFPKRDLEMYFNSGFLSVTHSDKDFLDLWIELTDKYGNLDVSLKGKGDISDWRKGGRWNSIFSPNQDTLNMALMLFEKPIVTLGPDAMDFVEGGVRLLPHAIGKNKPWRRQFLAEAFMGKPARLVDILFWKYANYPCPAFNKFTNEFKKIELKISKLVSRFTRKA